MPAGHIFALSNRLRDLSPQTRREIAASQSVAHYPGSPASPMTDAEVDSKLLDCLSIGRPNTDLASSFRAMAKRFAGIA
jgi:hypothetical protein